MKILHLLLPFFFIPLVNGMAFSPFELEQTVEEHTMTGGDTYSSDMDVLRLDSDEEHTMTGGDTYSSDMDVIRLDSDEVQPSSPSKRPKAIIALTLLAVILVLTLYTVNKLKAQPITKIERLEHELASFREHVRQREELDEEELEKLLKRLTPGQKVTLEVIEKKIKLFKEGKFTSSFFFFEQEIKENLMEFFVQGLKDGDDFDDKKKDFEALFPDKFFSSINLAYAKAYLEDTGGMLEYHEEGDPRDWRTEEVWDDTVYPPKYVGLKRVKLGREWKLVRRKKEYDYTDRKDEWKEWKWKWKL